MSKAPEWVALNLLAETIQSWMSDHDVSLEEMGDVRDQLREIASALQHKHAITLARILERSEIRKEQTS